MRATICPRCHAFQASGGPPLFVALQPRRPGALVRATRDRKTAGVLALLLGWTGAHKFYLGQTGAGFLFLLFFWTCIPGLVGIIEGIQFLSMSDERFAQLQG